MKKVALYIVTAFLLLVIVQNSYAELVTIAGRFITDRSRISCVLVKDENNNISIDVDFLNIMGAGRLKFTSNNTWDWAKVLKTTKTIKDYINNHDEINIDEMFKEAGLTGIRFVK